MEFLKKYSLLATIFFCFAIIFTSYFGGLRIPFYKIFQLLFIIFSILSFNKNRLTNNSKHFFIQENIFIFLVILFFIKILSGLVIIFNNYGPNTFDQYFKWVIVDGVDLLFYYYFIKYVLESTASVKKNIINTFALAIIASCIFSIIQFTIYYFYKYNIVSLITNLPFIWSQEDILDAYAWGPILRIGGFMLGPNVHATTLCLLLPIVLYSKIFRFRPYILFILFISLLFTLSRTGFVAFSVIIFLGLIYKKLSFKSVIYMGSLSTICLLFIYSSYSNIFDTILLRFNVQDAMGSRFDVFQNSFLLFTSNPLGVGINNFSEVYYLEYGLRGFNPHSDWLTLLVELGVIGLTATLIYYLYLLVITRIYSHVFTFPLFCIILSQCAAGFFNQTLVLFQTNLIMIMLYLYIISDPKNETFK